MMIAPTRQQSVPNHWPFSVKSECLLNESLKEQVLQLQKDLKGDTCLRQELGRSIELLKLNLGDEISGLEERLRDERERHSATKEAALRLEQGRYSVLS